jgi:hypothetical protein
MVEQASGVGPDSEPSGPDPIYGLALVVLGILTMGVAGAATLHYVFNAGTALTILGAMLFVGSMAVSSLKDSLRARAERKKQSAKPAVVSEGPSELGAEPSAKVESEAPPSDPSKA